MPAGDWDNPASMTSVDVVRDRIVSSVSPLPSVDLGLLEARGLVLSDDIIAQSDVPPFRNSAMDGYAIRSVETDGDAPSQFRVVETIPAGAAATPNIGPGQTARIMTGAPLPDGSDAVIRFEEAVVEGDFIRMCRMVRAGENVRLAGEDISSGQRVLRRGSQIGPIEIGLLAALNLGSVSVHRRPRVGILSTGDEVVDIGPDLGPGQIRDANAYALAARVEVLGGEAIRLGIAADSATAIRRGIETAHDCDLILTSGGVSVGDFDLVKEVLQQEGEIAILTVRMKPGKPLAFGHVGTLPLVGLPGNPAAAIVSFDQFVRPAILKMLGHEQLDLPTVQARLLVDVVNRGRRRHFERGVLAVDEEGWAVEPTGIHGSAMLSGLLAANCYIVIPEDVSYERAGAMVETQVLDPLSMISDPVNAG